MGMFDGDLVTVTTPDGRQVQMPSDLAASFPALQPAAPAGPVTMPDAGGDPGLAPAPPPVAAPPPPNVDAGPVTSPDQVPVGPGNTPQRAPVTEPGADQGAQPVAAAPPLTNKELLKEGPAGTLAAQNAALDKQGQAIEQSAQIQADTATKEGHILAARDARTQQILEERAKAAAENQAELQKRITDRDALAAQIANTRIDRSVDHPVWTAIGLILSAAGTAQKLRPGEKWDDPAYDTLIQQLDRKVDTQMKNLDIQRSAVAQMNVGIGEQRQMGMDRLSEIDVRRDAALQQAQQMVQTMATQMKSPLALAQARELTAKLDQDRATLRGQAAERLQAQVNTERSQAQTLQMHRESLAQQYKIHSETLAVQERDRMAQIAEKALEQGNKALADKAKKVSEGGLFDPLTRDPLLNPDGQKKFQQADQIEAQARQNPAAPALEYVKQLRQTVTTPEQKAKIDAVEARIRTDPQFASQAAHEYAQVMRDDARTNNAIVVDPKVATALREHINVANNATNQIDDLVGKLEKDPSAFNREQWAGIATQLGNLANVYQKTVGERVSTRAFDQTMKHILEFDPDSYFNREFNQKRALESLKELRKTVAGNIDSELSSQGVKTTWKPGETSDTVQFNAPEQTAQEIGADSQASGLARAGARIATLGTKSYDDLFPGAAESAANAAASQRGSEAGLSPNATTAIKGMAARADAAGDAERGRIVDTLKKSVANGLQEGGRTSLGYDMLDVLSSANPTLFKEVVAELPAEVRKRVEANERFKAGVGPANMPASELTPSNYDPERAASTYRDKETKRAAEDRVKSQDAYLNISRRAAEGQGY